MPQLSFPCQRVKDIYLDSQPSFPCTKRTSEGYLSGDPALILMSKSKGYLSGVPAQLLMSEEDEYGDIDLFPEL